MNNENQLDFDHPYVFHHACGVDEKTSIAIIGKLKKQELSFLEKSKFDFDSIGWPSIIEEKDLELNEHFPINLEEAVKIKDFVLFSSFAIYGTNKQAKEDKLYNILYSRFPLLEGMILESGVFSSYFAHVHNDSSLHSSRGQFNFIIDNPKGHALISRSSDGKFHKIVPEKGDIVFLDIHCDHALLPNQDEGFDVMRDNPMVVAFIS